jgi:hypothetical protein
MLFRALGRQPSILAARIVRCVDAGTTTAIKSRPTSKPRLGAAVFSAPQFQNLNQQKLLLGTPIDERQGQSGLVSTLVAAAGIFAATVSANPSAAQCQPPLLEEGGDATIFLHRPQDVASPANEETPQDDVASPANEEAIIDYTMYAKYPTLEMAFPILKDQNKVRTVSAATTEKKFTQFWPYWVEFCRCMERKPCEDYSTQRGLNLLLERAFSGSTLPSLEESYDKRTVEEFVGYVSLKKQCSGSLLDGIGTMVNAWMKAEYYCRASQTGHAQTAFIPGSNFGIGHNSAITAIRKRFKKDSGERMRSEMIDLHHDIDNRITKEQDRTMMANVFETSASKSINPLYKLMFGQTYCQANAETRRGDEYRKTQFNYLFTREINAIGPNGLLCPLRLLNESKTNKEGMYWRRIRFTMKNGS